MFKTIIIIVVIASTLLITGFKCSSHQDTTYNSSSDPNSLNSYINALDSEDDGVIFDAVESISSIARMEGLDDPDVVLAKYSRILNESENIELKIAIVYAAANIGRIPDPYLSEYKEEFNSDDSNVRRNAEQRLLQEFRVFEDVAEILLNVLDDSSCIVVIRAANQLASLSRDANWAYQKYSEYTSEEINDIHALISEIVSNVNDLPDDTYSELIICVQNDYSIVTDISTGAFRSIGPEPVIVDALIEYIEERDDDAGNYNLLALANYGVDAIRAVPAIVGLVNDDYLISSPDGLLVRTTSLTALGCLGRYDDLAVQTLIDVLNNDPEPRMRWFAAYELEVVGPKPGVVDALYSALNDESIKVRNMAIQTLGYMGKAAEYVIPKLKEIQDSEDDKGVRGNIDLVIDRILNPEAYKRTGG